MIHYRKDTNNIVTLTLNMANRPSNILNHEIVAAFVPVLEHLKQEKAKRKLRGVILTSGKKTFLEGGDLEYVYDATDPKEIFGFSQKLQHFFRELENPGVPVVAAINGTTLATGFEMVLACHHRIVIANRNILLGLPEVKYGLMPGNGGLTRMMWLLGIEKTLPIVLEGRTYRPKEALKVGIVDDLAKDHKDMIAKAKTWILEKGISHRPWDREDGKIPFGTANSPYFLEKTPIWKAKLLEKYHNNFPAPTAILEAIIEGSKVNFDTATKIESRIYTKLWCSKEAKNMIKAFWFDNNTIRAGESRPKGFGRFRPKKIGIIGAGKMGSGIALSCLRSGLEVVIKDISKPIAEKGRIYVKEKLETAVKRGQVTEKYLNDILARITTTQHASEFETCDLVIEAVFENKSVKRKVMKEAESYMDKYSIFGTNTISIPITKLAKASARPSHYIGLHFFAPADKVPLVEIVSGEKTSLETLARAYDFVKAIKKTPVVVKDSWGFYGMRVQNTYILEGITMLKEGVPPAIIENLGLQAGMPKGPLSLADELGLNFVMEYENQAAEHYGPKYTQHPATAVLDKMTEEFKRLGKRKLAGFYEYPKGEFAHLWKDMKEHFPSNEIEIFYEEIKERLLMVQVLEALWCLQEKVVRTVPEANLGSIYGWGFPKYKGGVIQYINDYNIEEFVKKCNAYKKIHGARFQVPKKLRELVVQVVE